MLCYRLGAQGSSRIPHTLTIQTQQTNHHKLEKLTSLQRCNLLEHSKYPVRTLVPCLQFVIVETSCVPNRELSTLHVIITKLKLAAMCSCTKCVVVPKHSSNYAAFCIKQIKHLNPCRVMVFTCSFASQTFKRPALNDQTMWSRPYI